MCGNLLTSTYGLREVPSIIPMPYTNDYTGQYALKADWVVSSIQGVRSCLLLSSLMV